MRFSTLLSAGLIPAAVSTVLGAVIAIPEAAAVDDRWDWGSTPTDDAAGTANAVKKRADSVVLFPWPYNKDDVPDTARAVKKRIDLTPGSPGASVDNYKKQGRAEAVKKRLTRLPFPRAVLTRCRNRNINCHRPWLFR